MTDKPRETRREILRRVLFGEPKVVVPKRELDELKVVREKLTEDILKTTAGKPDSWLAKQRTNLNEAWKKTHHETRSMFCFKGKHERCTFDPDCSCHCHPRPATVTV